MPLNVFCCYAHRDRALCEELIRHLAPLVRSGLIAVWYDGNISPGTVWEKEIEAHLSTARIILLLVSPDFFFSDYCYSKEVTRALERHHAQEARVISVLLRPTDWTNTPFSSLQVFPSNAQPITSWSDRDEAFEDIAQGIRRVVNDLLSQGTIAPNSPVSTRARKPLLQVSRSCLSQQILLLLVTGLLILNGGLAWLAFFHLSSGPPASPSSRLVSRPTVTTDCAHLVTPWVALYQYSHFGGRELCFEGKGLINLSDFGFDRETEAINIAANGVFFDQPDGKGTQLRFYYGDQESDLGSWNNRISSFRVDS